MDKHIDECAKVFLRDQKQLFDEPVAYDLEEAKEWRYTARILKN